MLKVRFKIDVFLRSGHTVRMEATEYEFEYENSGQYCKYHLTNILQYASFSVTDIVGFKVVGKSYRFK